MLVYDDLHSRGQGNGHKTHPKHNEHVEAIKKGREYLVEAWFSQGGSKRQVTSYRDHLSKKIDHVSSIRQASQSPRRTAW